MSDFLVINFIGPPAVGKTTYAARTFSWLKENGIVAGYVPEAASEYIWEGCQYKLDNQLLIVGEQKNKIERLKRAGYGIAVSDSPLLLSAVYNKKLPQKSFEEICLYEFNSYSNLIFFLSNVRNYTSVGRTTTLEDSFIISRRVKDLLCRHKLEFYEVSAFEEITAKLEHLIGTKP